MEDERKTTEVTETSNTNNTNGTTNVQKKSVVQTTPPPSGAIIFRRVVWYITGVIIALLVIRLILQLLGANDDAPFVNFIYTISGIFAAPFYGIFNYQPTYGQSYFEISTVVAIIVYFLIGWGIAKLSTITRPREEV